MISLKKANIVKLTEDNCSASFSISPLPKGYGSTLGTVLRRTLLSSVAGYGIVSVKINGVSHEYSTLEGVTDDVLTILLSLKNIAFKVSTLEPVELSLSKNGSKGEIVEVRASDFEKNSHVEIVNPDYIITRLTDETNLNIIVKIARGYGYEHQKDVSRDEVEALPLDTYFSPVLLVSYDIRPARVGKDTELDELVLNIKTNNTLTPEEALVIAIDVLSEGFQHLQSMSQNILDNTSVVLELNELAKQEIESSPKKTTASALKVSEMNLSTRLSNALVRSGIEDLNQLANMSEEEIANIRGLGNKSYLELLDIIRRNNIKLK